jgi:hypothetical protein
MSTRTDVPIHLHPLSLDAHNAVLDVPETLGVQVLGSARDTLQVVHDTFAAINDAETVLKKTTNNLRMVNGRPQFHGATEEFGKAATARATSILPKVDSALKGLNGIATVLAERVENAIKDPAANTPHGVAVGQEIRAFVRAMSPSDRIMFLRDTVTSGDRRTLNAILNSPAYLSGIDAGMADNLRDQAAMQFARQDFTQLNATRDVIAKVSAAGSALLGRAHKATQMGKTPQAAAAEAVAKLASGK